MEIVKGNDISISWRIYRIVDGVKVPENLTTATDFLTLVTANGLNVPITNSTISDTNLITILIKGRDLITGIYALEASWTSSLGEDSRVAYGKAFTVVDKQCQADYTLPEGLDVVSLEFYSSTHFGALYENLDVLKDPTKEAVLGELHNNVLTYDSSINKWYGKPVKNYDRLDAWSDYSVGKEGWVLSAKLGKQLYDTKLNISAISGWVLQPTFPGYTKEEIDAMIDSGGSGDTFWELHPTEPNTIYTTYNVVSAGEISAYGVGDSGGGPGGVNLLQAWADYNYSKELWAVKAGLLVPFYNDITERVQALEDGSGSVDWVNISNKPPTFPPSAHTHTKSQITDFAHTHPFSEITGIATTSQIPNLAISKITGLQTALDLKLDKSIFDDFFEWDSVNNAIKAKYTFYSIGEVSAYGLGTGGSGGESYDRLDAWVDYNSTKAGWVLSAFLGKDLDTRVGANSSSILDLNQRVNAIEDMDSDKNFVHTQGVSSDTWTISHTLNKYPSVTIIDSGGTEVIGNIKYIDPSTVIVTFASGFSGKAILN